MPSNGCREARFAAACHASSRVATFCAATLRLPPRATSNRVGSLRITRTTATRAITPPPRISLKRRRSVKSRKTRPAPRPTNVPRERLSTTAAEIRAIITITSGRSTGRVPSSQNVSGNVVPSTNAKSLTSESGSLATYWCSPKYALSARIAAIEAVIESTQAMRVWRRRSPANCEMTT
jgi:hypothetical protein